ncbi:hypothetical protein DYB25_004220, partial [Aphanomyces astaci]
DDDVDAPDRQSHSGDDSYSNESASDQGVDVDSDDEQDVTNHGPMYGVMAWSQRSPTLWMPAYVCDPFKLRSTLELLEEASTRLPPGFTPSDMRLVARDPQASSDDEGATSAAAHTTAVAPKAARSLDVDTRSSRSPKRRKSTRNHLPASPPPVTTKPRTVPSQSRPPPPAKKRARSPSPAENNSNHPTRASFDPKDSAVAIGPGFTQPMRHGGVMQASNSYVRHTPPSKRPTEPDRPAPVAPAVKEVRITETAIKDIPLDSMAWARRSDTLSASSPWWPVYVCDPERLQPTLEHLGASIKTTMEGGGYLTTSFYIHAGNRHQKLLVTAKQYPNSLRLVYLFGGTPDVCAKNMARWRGPDHDLLLKGHPAHAVTGRVVREFARAKYAATDAYTRLLPDMAESDMVPRYIPPQVPPYSAFLKRDPRQRLLPYMVPTDMNLALPAPEKYAIPLNQMVWALSDAYPWLPAFVCDPEHLPCDLRALGDDTATDQELEGELSVNSKAMRNKRSISQHGETKKAADDFKYNPTQRQVLQGLYMIEWHGLSCSVAIELKEEVAPDKIEGLLPLGRAKRHSGTSDATHENAVDNMQHSSDTSEIVETDPTFVKYDLEDDMQDLLTPVDPEPPVVRSLDLNLTLDKRLLHCHYFCLLIADLCGPQTDGGTPQKSTANDNAASHSTKLAGTLAEQ